MEARSRCTEDYTARSVSMIYLTLSSYLSLQSSCEQISYPSLKLSAYQGWSRPTSIWKQWIAHDYLLNHTVWRVRSQSLQKSLHTLPYTWSLETRMVCYSYACACSTHEWYWLTWWTWFHPAISPSCSRHMLSAGAPTFSRITGYSDRHDPWLASWRCWSPSSWWGSTCIPHADARA